MYFLRISTKKRVEPCRWVHIYEADKTFYNTLPFCILKSLKSLQNVLKSPQITPEVPKSIFLGHIFSLGLAKTVFLHCPLPLPRPGEPPHISGPPLFGLPPNGLFTFGRSLIGLQGQLDYTQFDYLWRLDYRRLDYKPLGLPPNWTTYDVWTTAVWTTPQIDYTVIGTTSVWTTKYLIKKFVLKQSK